MVVVAVDVTFVQVVVLYLFDDKVIGAYPPLRKRGMRLTNILEDHIYHTAVAYPLLQNKILIYNQLLLRQLLRREGLLQ